MMDLIDKYNALAGMCVVILSGLFGQFWFLFALYLLFNVLDWLTGWHRAAKLKTESSGAGWRGAKKKVWSWVILVVAFSLPVAFIELGQHLLGGLDLSFLSLFGWFVLATLLVNEARSILENLVEAGYQVPGILIQGLAITEKMIKDRVQSTLPEQREDENE